MGIYDRDYYRSEPRRSLIGNWSAVNFLIVVNVAIFVLDQFTDPVGHGARWLDFHMALSPELVTHPWTFWTLLSYGFAHAPQNIIHVGGNMFVLWVFGVDVERLYGRDRFMRVYLSLIVCSGLAWVAIQQFSGSDVSVVGASGAIMGIGAIYIYNFPHRVFLFYFVLPVPAWAIGIFYIGLDFFGVVSPNPKDTTAHAAHIAGAVFGLLYARTGWSLGSILPTRWPKWAKFGGPPLRVHTEDDQPRTQREVQTRVDEILEKISREGEASLTPAERRELEDLSRRFRNRR